MKNRDNSGKPTPEDQKIWNDVTRSVTAYVSKKEKAPSLKRGHPPSKQARTDLILQKTLKLSDAPAFDPETARNLKKGKMKIEARLDLHGFSQEKALLMLEAFISKAVMTQKRTLLVITGKGKLSPAGGVLRRMLPLWLERPVLKKYILAWAGARPEHGGSGAFYIRLRKTKA